MSTPVNIGSGGAVTQQQKTAMEAYTSDDNLIGAGSNFLVSQETTPPAKIAGHLSNAMLLYQVTVNSEQRMFKPDLPCIPYQGWIPVRAINRPTPTGTTIWPDASAVGDPFRVEPNMVQYDQLQQVVAPNYVRGGKYG